MSGLETTRAVLLRAHPYSESSLILRFFTEDLGVVGVLAHGVRRQGSKGGSGLQTFASGWLTLYMKATTELHTFKDFAISQPRLALGLDLIRFGGASLVSELILRQGSESAAPNLFRALESALDKIAEAEGDAVLPVTLAEAWVLVTTLGYHPLLDVCVQCESALVGDEVGRFDFAAGGVRCASCSVGASGPRIGPEGREQVRGLLSGQPQELARASAHLRLLSEFVTYHVSGSRPLESFDFLASLLPVSQASP